MASQHKASFGAQAIALQNILQALITQGHSNAKYLSPKLRADKKLLEMLALAIAAESPHPPQAERTWSE